jgi:hypothetical protein
VRHWPAMTGRECLIDLDVIARQLSRAIGTDGGMCWADIPQLSTQDRRCPAVRQQYWQRLRPTGTDLRPSANEGRDISQVWADLRVFCAVAGRRCLPLVAAVAVTVAVG